MMMMINKLFRRFSFSSHSLTQTVELTSKHSIKQFYSIEMFISILFAFQMYLYTAPFRPNVMKYRKRKSFEANSISILHFSSWEDLLKTN